MQVAQHLQDAAQRCIDVIDPVKYYTTLFLVLYPDIDAVVVGDGVSLTFWNMFLAASFDAHVETIHRIANK